MIDVDGGYVLSAMTRGIRLTTGAEFARLDAPPTPVQLAKVEPMARDLFPLGEPVDAKPWLGRRPCLPDMLPAIGPVPGRRGLWLDLGHHHLGFTLGPVTGRLLAEMMTRRGDVHGSGALSGGPVRMSGSTATGLTAAP